MFRALVHVGRVRSAARINVEVMDVLETPDVVSSLDRAEISVAVQTSITAQTSVVVRILVAVEATVVAQVLVGPRCNGYSGALGFQARLLIVSQPCGSDVR